MNVQQLLTTVPQVRGWILTALEQYQTHARPVASYYFSVLAQFFSADALTSAVAVEVPKVPVPLLAEMGLPEFTAFQNGKSPSCYRMSDSTLPDPRLQSKFAWRLDAGGSTAFWQYPPA